MAGDSTSSMRRDSINLSQSGLSIDSNSTMDSMRSTASSVFTNGSNSRRYGLLNKLGAGVQSVFRRFSRPHTSLTEMETQILAVQTGFRCDEILEWHKKFLAECPNGHMTRKQFIATYKALFPQSDAERFARHVFRALDLDRSNTVDFREFLLGASMTASTNSPETKLQWTFQVFDIDGNGLLTRRECLEVIESIVRFYHSSQLENSHVTVDQLITRSKRSMMRIFDTLSDVRGNQLTMTQFVQGCLKDEFITNLLAPDTSFTEKKIVNDSDLNEP